MAETGKKVAPLVAGELLHGWGVFCPACNNVHVFDKRWTFNGNEESPSFSPSMLVYAHDGGQPRCHSYVTDGKWRYLDDCEHAMRGCTVDVPDFTWG